MSNAKYGPQELEAFTSRFYNGRPLLLVPFAYTAVFATLAPTAQASVVVNIAANADFMMLALHHRCNIAAAQNVSTKTAPFVRVLITDSGSNEQFTNVAVDLENYGQNGNMANALPYPRIVGGRSTLNVQVTNYTTVAGINQTYTDLELYFEGVLIRAYQGSTQSAL